MIKVYLVDDVAEVRQMVRERITLEADMQVVGEANSVYKALEEIAENRPDVVLMDVKMPEVNGIQATQILHNFTPPIQVVILSLYDDPESRSEAKEAGAVSFVAKDEPEESWLSAIRKATSKP